MRNKYLGRYLLLLSLLFAGNCPLTASADTLVGIEMDTGNLYQISTVDASLSLVGKTVTFLASLEFASNGSLYGYTSGTNSLLYRIDPATAQATEIGPLGVDFIFEGGVAFAPDGTAYGCNGNNVAHPQLFRLELTTGLAAIIGTISVDRHDINGLAWRSDGMLVGLDRVSNSLLAIDPTNASVSMIAFVEAEVGGNGGMTAQGDIGYFATAGAASSTPGSNELYSFDLFSGAHVKIGSLAPTIQGAGLGGLALVPQPSRPRLSVSQFGGLPAKVAWATNFTGYTLV